MSVPERGSLRAAILLEDEIPLLTRCRYND